jgi:hypothetical protein
LKTLFLLRKKIIRTLLIAAKNLILSQIKSACNWEQAIYKGEWYWKEQTETWVVNNKQAKQDIAFSYW